MFQTSQPLKHANLECLRKKELPKTGGDGDLKPVDFQNMCEIKLNKADYSEGLLLSWYSLSYRWSLLYCLVYLLAVIRRFCFTENADKAFPQT